MARRKRGWSADAHFSRDAGTEPCAELLALQAAAPGPNHSSLSHVTLVTSSFRHFSAHNHSISTVIHRIWPGSLLCSLLSSLSTLFFCSQSDFVAGCRLWPTCCVAFGNDWMSV